MARPVLALLVVALVAGGCGSSADDDFRTAADRECERFDRAAFDGQKSIAEARRVHADFEAGLERLEPPAALRRAHATMLEYARGGERLFRPQPGDDGAPKVDLKLTSGDANDRAGDVERDGLEICAAVLRGESQDPAVEVIR